MSSTYVDLGIGLALAFLVLSLLVSALQEGVTRVLGLRSKFLWAYLRDQFEGSEKNGGQSRLPATVPQLLRLAVKDPRPDFANKPASALALDIDEDKGTKGRADDFTVRVSAEALHERLREIDRKSWLRGRTCISQIPARRFATATLELADAAKGVPAWLDELKAAHSPLYRPMNSAWTAADTDAAKFALTVEAWFDAEMERLSRLYRAHIRSLITGIALAIAIFTGFDSLAYGHDLMADGAFRTEAVAVASGNPDSLQHLQGVCAAQHSSDAVGQVDGQQAPPDPYACVSEVLGNPALARIMENAMISADLSAKDGAEIQWNGKAWWNRIKAPAHWLGLIGTVVALLFGGPFWWDLLRRLTGVRSAQSTAKR